MTPARNAARANRRSRTDVLWLRTLSHPHLHRPLRQSSDRPEGGFGDVDTSFVLSGLVITGERLHEQDKTTTTSLRSFEGNRRFRIIRGSAVILVRIVIATVLGLGTERSREQGSRSAECQRQGRRPPSGLSWRI